MTPPLSTTELSEDVPLSDDPRTPEEAAPDLAPHPPGDLGPIKANERIAEMDILRGFALLGICVINLQDFLGPHGIAGDTSLYPSWYDQTAEFLVNLFGQGKFNAMFSFLFGVGFAIQMDRAAAKQTSFASMYVRRLMALLLFGAAHLVLLWGGDVLHIYAIIGLPLILFRRLKDRWLWTIMVLTLVGPFIFVGVMYGMKQDPEPSKKDIPAHEAYEKAQEKKKEIKAREGYDRAVESLKTHGKGDYLIPPYMPLAERKRREKAGETTPVPRTEKVVATGGYLDVVTLRVKDWVRGMRKGAAIFWAILGTTLIIGFIAGRRGIFQDIPGHMKLIRWVTLIGGIFGLGISLLFAVTSLFVQEKTSVMGLVAISSYIFGRPLLCAFYMGAIILMAQTDRFRNVLKPLALVGRMPLTNYLTHSVVFSTLFYGYGLGWYYRVGPALSLVIAFSLYAMQVVFSNWWMNRFRFGPMEWLWRTLTYGKPPAMRLATTTTA